MGGRRKVSERREPAFDAAPRRRVEPQASRPVTDGGRAQHKRRRRGRRPRSFVGRFFYWGAVASLWFGIALIGVTIWIGAHLPPIQTLEVPKRPPTIHIVDHEGRSLATRGDMGGAAVALRDLPRYVPQAFVAIEDRRFYSHYGIDPVGVLRAAFANLLRRGVSQGGSTITQQLAKNLFLTQERTLTRKVQEVVLALWLERKYSKTEILELYLNRVYFGAGAYGVEAATQRYFGKPAQKLTVAEAAMLAGLVRSPSRLAPSRNPDGAERRAQVVLAAMADMKYISDDMAKAAIMRPAAALKSAGAGSIGYVADWVMDVLDDLIGRVEQDITVETSIDPALQAAAEKALVDELTRSGDRAGVGQGALVAMTPDGAVRALVGGRNYAESQFNRAVAARRQPGSAFKPFVYLTALEHGLTPDSVREDKPIVLKGWQPENYGREYFGAVTLRQALAHSLNTVSVRLTLEFGPQAVARTAYRLGIASRLEPNPSLALGTSDVSVMELVAAYATFANGGYATAPHVVERVRVTNGKQLYTRPTRALGRVLDARYVGMMNVMMQETLLSGTARKADLPGWPAAGKTGTSQDFRDSWFVGYTGRLVTGVWLGNDDGTPTRRVTGGGLPVQIWSRFMRTAHQGVPVATLPGWSAGPFAGFGPPFGGGASPPPVPLSPPVAVPNASAPPRPTPAGGIDDWLLDRLFGRR